MTDKILVTGGTGMVGSALKKIISNAIFISSKDYDLRDPSQTEMMFCTHKPRYVIHLAAKVGGVKGNKNHVADFYTENIQINTNVLQAAGAHRVQKVVSLLSTCIYPDEHYVNYPLTEEQLHLGPPHESNFGYAYAKRMIEVQSRAYNQQFPNGTKYYCAVPNNIFGTEDNFDLENGHVMPAIIRKVWEAKNSRESVFLWGDGSPLREFTWSQDVARALLFILWNIENPNQIYNIGNTQELSIKMVADAVAKEMNYSGEIKWDATKPKGQFRKPSSNKLFLEKSNFTYTPFEEALKNTCDWFKLNYPYVRGVEKTNGNHNAF